MNKKIKNKDIKKCLPAHSTSQVNQNPNHSTNYTKNVGESQERKSNEVIRVKKRPSNFVIMDKTFLEDDRLSFRAKGILAYLLSKPDNWKVLVSDLMNHSTDGKRSVYAGLKELKECGYYKKIPIRNESGTRIERWESTIFENPILDVENHESETPETPENSGVCLLPRFEEIQNEDIQNVHIQNVQHNNNYNNNNKLNNNESSLSSPSIVEEVEEKEQEDQTRQTDGRTAPTPVMPSVDTYREYLKDNINYQDLKSSHPQDMPLVDECIQIMLDTIFTNKPGVRINRENKPKELVVSTLMKVTYADIVHVIYQFSNQTTPIKRKAAYILTMLYMSTLERHAHYKNMVRADWGAIRGPIDRK